VSAAAKLPKVGAGLSVNTAAHAAANDLTSKKRLSTKWQRQKSAKSSKKFGVSTPDTKGKLLTLKHLKAFQESRHIADGELPKEVSVRRFLKVLRDVIEDKSSKGESTTTSGVLGDCWEKLALDYPQVKGVMEVVLRDGSLYLLDAFLRTHLTEGSNGFEGFLNGQGNFTGLDALADSVNITGAAREKRRLLRTELINRVKQAQSGENLDKMLASGLVYADSLSIGKEKFKDGLYAMQIGEYWLWLTDIEFKTAGSKGVTAQSATAFVRLAGADSGATISFRVGGKTHTPPIDKILFNPLDLDAHVGVKAGKVDQGDFAEAAGQALKERLAPQKRQRAQIPSAARTNFGDDLKTLATNLYKVGVETDLKGMRKIIFDLLNTVK